MVRWKESMTFGLLCTVCATSAHAHGMEGAPLVLALSAGVAGVILGAIAGAIGFGRSWIWVLSAMAALLSFVSLWLATMVPNPILGAVAALIAFGIPLVISVGVGYAALAGLRRLFGARRKTE